MEHFINVDRALVEATVEKAFLAAKCNSNNFAIHASHLIHSGLCATNCYVDGGIIPVDDEVWQVEFS